MTCQWQIGEYESVYNHGRFLRTCSVHEGLSWPWSYGSWIYNYQRNQCLSPLMFWVRLASTAICDKVCRWLARGRWFSPGPPVSSINRTYCLDITEILLKVALNTNKQTNNIPFNIFHLCYIPCVGNKIFHWAVFITFFFLSSSNFVLRTVVSWWLRSFGGKQLSKCVRTAQSPGS